MRKVSPQTVKLRCLLSEYKRLKRQLFRSNSPFVVLDPKNRKVKRYNQLLAYFRPEFRTKDFKNPMGGI